MAVDRRALPATLPQAVARPLTTAAATAPPAPTPPQAAGSREYAEGVAALQAGDFQNAIRLLRLAVAAANRPEYRITLAEALERSGAIPDSLAEYEAAFNLEQGDAPVRRDVGQGAEPCRPSHGGHQGL